MCKNDYTANNSLKPSLPGKMVSTTVYCKKKFPANISFHVLLCKSYAIFCYKSILYGQLYIPDHSSLPEIYVLL